MRLIDADVFCEMLDSVDPENNADSYYGYTAGEIEEALRKTPTVEATVFPCNIGDPVWFVGTSNTNRLNLGVIEATVEKLVLKSSGIYMKLSCNAVYETSCRSIGKSVFFSNEEAEAALARMKG